MCVVEVSGVVINSSTGQPIKEVLIETESMTTNTSIAPVKTNPDGSFRVDKLKKGETYQLTFKKETINPKQEEYSPAKLGKAAKKLTIHLDEFSLVKGKVFGKKNAQSDSLSGAVVELLEKKSESWIQVPNLSDRTKSDGSFIIAGITKAGSYRLEISGASYRTIRYPIDTSDPKYLKGGDVWEIEDGTIVLEPIGVIDAGGITPGANTKLETGGTVTGVPLTETSQGQIVQKPQTPMQQGQQSQEMQNGSMQGKESTVQTFCRLYNVAVEDSNRRSEFTQRYQPLRVGVANASERGRDSDKEPDFQTSPHGDYYAVAVEGDMLYAVVPRFDVTLQSVSYGPGAMGLVFDCPNYDPQLRYRRVKVAKPAFFEPDPEKQHWTLKEKGELDLGKGE
ncbi:carboxypeptidase regulatory-like domain-containing protein [Candidatus Poribacteria bacterium]|nr:carboxypeptidase regulatory-like domain-containing protein [Candidatus Poribacteria bacterium]